MQSPSGPKVYPKSTHPLEEEEEEEEFITSGNWRGKHNSLSSGAGAAGPKVYRSCLYKVYQ